MVTTSKGWDSSLVDPTTQPVDGFRVYTAGGRSGPLALENGAKLTFPWAKQQQIAATSPALIYVDDDVPSNAERLRIYGPLVNPATRSDRSYIELGGSYTPSTDPGLTIRTTGNNGALVAGVYLYQNTISWTASGGTPDVNFQALGGVVRWNAAQSKIIAGTGATIPAPLGTGATHALKVGSDTFALNNYYLGIDGRYIQAYTGASNLANTLELNPSGGNVNIGGVDIAQALLQWGNYTPTITQGVAVSKTVTYSRYCKIGRTVIWAISLAITSSGTAGQPIYLSYPWTPADTGNNPAGVCQHYNGSVSQPLLALKATAGVAFEVTSASSSGFYSATLASGHNITGIVIFEATT